MIRVTIPTVYIPATPAWYEQVALPVGTCHYCRMIGHVRRDTRDKRTSQPVQACMECGIAHAMVPESGHVVEAQQLQMVGER